MSYRFAVQEEQDLLVVVFEGDISPEEEREALDASADLPGLSDQTRILVDRRAARMESGAADIDPQLNKIHETFVRTERPHMAVLVGNDRDFGMLRMLELNGQDQLPHELKVFRDLFDACDWVGVEFASIKWP